MNLVLIVPVQQNLFESRVLTLSVSTCPFSSLDKNIMSVTGWWIQCFNTCKHMCACYIQCSHTDANVQYRIYCMCNSLYISFLPAGAAPGQQSKRRPPQVWIPQPQEGRRMSRTSQNPPPCRSPVPTMTNRRQPTLPERGKKTKEGNLKKEEDTMILSFLSHTDLLHYNGII